MTADPAVPGAAAADSVPDLPPDPHQPQPHHQSFWLWVMCLTGVDYFSTLGYQPSIAFEATGLLTPFATLILVLVTLCGALPVYAYVAGQSPHGQGSIGMLERLMRGWGGKIVVLVLLGFAATDFVITKTLSAADAAAHLIANPLVRESFSFSRSQLVVTMALLVLLGAMFLRGFKEVIGLAVVLVGVYLILNAIVVGSGVYHVLTHPGAVDAWLHAVHDPTADVVRDLHVEHAPFSPGGSWLGIFALSALLFPKLALGLSGFETGVAVMPLVRGGAGDTHDRPAGRIRNTRKLLITAALVMSVLLIGSSVVTSTLIDPHVMRRETQIDPETGQEIPGAKDRALAYLAHGELLKNGRRASEAINPLFGEWFGTCYDLSTIAILWFAGASAMAALLNLVPQYLPRYGMAPEWARAVRPLVLLFTGINLFVTWEFDASVEKQGAAYATGVLVLISSACLASVIAMWRAREGPWYRRLPWLYAGILIVFCYTTAANIVERPVGLFIAMWFILGIVAASIVSRLRRSKELRFAGWKYVDEHSHFLWDSLKHLEFPVLVPHRPGGRSLAAKEETIRQEHRLGPEVPVVFVEAERGDPSEFYQTPLMEVIQQEGRFIIRVTRCASIPHAIATLALELSQTGAPPEIHFGWSNESPMAANLSFVLFGEGNVPWMVRELVLQAEPDPQRQPRIVVG